MKRCIEFLNYQFCVLAERRPLSWVFVSVFSEGFEVQANRNGTQSLVLVGMSLRSVIVFVL